MKLYKVTLTTQFEVLIEAENAEAAELAANPHGKYKRVDAVEYQATEEP